MDWRDYGLDEAPISENSLFIRIEIITARGIYAYLSSDPNSGQALHSSATGLDIQLSQGHRDLIRIAGWPVMHWQFQNVEGTLGVDLRVTLNQLTVWPDFLMPNNTFGVSVGSAAVVGQVLIEGKTTSVAGAAVFDHPRIVVQPNQVAPFGWYLYSPIRFSDGTQLACYYAEDGFGQRDEIYSAAMMVWNGEGHWLADCQASKLKLDTDGLPVQWENRLSGEGCSASFSVNICQLPLVRGWGEADPSRERSKYVAYPLLMEVEGEAQLHGKKVRLEDGSGIAEFLVRRGLQPRFS